MVAVIAVWLILWHCAYPLSFAACAILIALILSNLLLISHSTGFDTRVVAKYLLIADGIALPVAAIAANSPAPEVHLVFVIAILVASASTWPAASLVSFAVGATVNTLLALSEQTDYYVGSLNYRAYLCMLFCVSVFGYYFSTRFRRHESQIEHMRGEIEEKELTVSKTAEAVSYWTSIYETVTHGISSGVVLSNRDMRIIFVNKTFLEMAGAEPGQLPTRTSSQDFSEEVIAELGLREKLQHVRDTGKPLELQEIKIAKPGGQSCEALFSAFPIRDQEHQVGFVAAVFNDVTELKKARGETSEAKRQYRSLFTDLPSAFAIFSLADESLIRYNYQFEVLTGYTLDELMDKSFRDFLPGGNLRSVVRKFLYEIGEDAKPTATIELKIVIANGAELDVEAAFESYFVGDQPVGIQAVIRDITDRKAAEKEAERRRVQARLALKKMLEQKLITEEVRRLDALKSEFVSMVSHELRTPMASIKGALGMMADETAGPINDEQRKWIDMALRNVDRLTILLNDTLDVAKIASGKFPLHPEEIDLLPLVEEIGKEYSVKAAETGHSIRWECAEPPVCAFADAEAVRRILVNLVGNALFHTPAGSKIVVGAYCQDGMPCLAVKDNGNGIAPENLTRIFERFFQADRPTGDGPKGTGLGLSICKGLVEQMGGNISVQSELGKGATFLIALPAGPGTSNIELASDKKA